MKAPGFAIVVGAKHPEDEDEDDDKSPDSSEGMSHDEHKASMDDAADEMFDALKSGNKEHFRMALEAYCDLHKAAPEDEPSMDDMDGGDEDEDGEPMKKGGLHL